jgi:hypothetical protein
MNNTEKIDAYLRETLSEAEKNAFEAELDQNAEMAAELALQKDMEQFLRNQERRTALKDQLENMGGEFFQATTSTEKGRIVPLRRHQTLRWVIGLAATIALILLARFLLQPASLYEQYGQHPPLAMIEKSNAAQDKLAAIEHAFNQKDYSKALPLLRAYAQEKPADEQATFYLGICLLETKQYAAARSIFQELSAKQTSSFADFGQWYLALSYLKEGDEAACLKVLQEVPAESEFGEKARDLLRKL